MNSLLGYCGHAPTDLQDAGFASEKDLTDFLHANNVSETDAIEAQYQIQFAFELNHFPAGLRSYLVHKDAEFHIIQGYGVTDDPTFQPNPPTTSDGRSWSTIPGVGTDPTRIVVNRLYDGHGSVNLVLHERAHTLDYHGLPGMEMISSSSEWTEVMTQDKAFMTLLAKVCGAYCTDSTIESFAEGFAMYFSCDKSRALLKDAKILNAFMKKLEAFQDAPPATVQ